MAGRISIALVLFFSTFSSFALDRGPELPPGMADLTTGEGFIVLETDSRIRYEEGAEEAARKLEELLPEAVGKVERAHKIPFCRPVEVFVLATARSFVRLSPSAEALTSRARVYLSPRLFENSARVAGVLTHELSHAHFMQCLGSANAPPDIPTWFREGFAVWIAGGAGAERVSPAEAAEAIRSGSPPPPEGHWRSVPGPHMLYRQSAMFVEYLRSEPARFDFLIANVLAGVSFQDAFVEAYERGVDQMWEKFAAGLRATG